MEDRKTCEKNKISDLTRRDIIDFISVEAINWAGRLSEPDFLQRIYNLETMSSTDDRFNNAYGDIFQHRINNDDWDDDWIFFDSRFGLMDGDDEVFLRFLCEMLHPAVRPDVNETMKIYTELNSYLKHDGYQLEEIKQLSGKPVFSSREVGILENPVIQKAKGYLTEIDEFQLSLKIKTMESAIETDPGLAIGASKELIESLCKTIIFQRTNENPDEANINQLTGQVAKLLSLSPKGIPNEAKAADTIKKVLGSLSAITHHMAELRNAYGSGHGKKAGTRGLGPRHARLVVGMASTLAIFLWDTHIEKADN